MTEVDIPIGECSLIDFVKWFESFVLKTDDREKNGLEPIQTVQYAYLIYSEKVKFLSIYHWFDDIESDKNIYDRLGKKMIYEDCPFLVCKKLIIEWNEYLKYHNESYVIVEYLHKKILSLLCQLTY